MEQKKAMLQALIADMRKKMLDGDGDKPLDPGDAVAESAMGEEKEEQNEELQEVLETEEQELAAGKDLDGDGKPGDADLVAAIKKYMSGDNGAAKMKVGPVMGSISTFVARKPEAPTQRKFGGKK